MKSFLPPMRCLRVVVFGISLLECLTACGGHSTPPLLTTPSTQSASIAGDDSAPTQPLSSSVCISASGTVGVYSNHNKYSGPCGGINTGASPTPSSSAEFAYVTNSKNIFAYSVNASTGALSPVPGSPIVVPRAERLGRVTVDPMGKFVYVLDDKNIFAYGINARVGALTPVPGSPFGVGGSNALAVDPRSKFLYVIGTSTVPPFNSGILAYTINANNGALTPVPGSPFAAGASDRLVVDPRGKFLYVSIQPTDFTEGGILAYTINESSGALAKSSFSVDPGLELFDIAVDPTGKFLYNEDGGRLARAVSGYSINATTGALTSVPGSPFQGGYPEGLAVDPRGEFVYTYGSPDFKGQQGVFSAYAINASSGTLKSIANFWTDGDSISDAAVDPLGKFVYVVHSKNVFAYAINASSGALTLLPGSPFAAGIINPLRIAISHPH